jgi:plastocyanin
MASRHSRLLPIAAVAAALALSACGGDDGGSGAGSTAASAPGSSITIRDFAFSPKTLEVGEGTSVDVSNDDSTAHTVTADDGTSFDSGQVQPDGSKSITAPSAGRYAYHCSIHPNMHGELTVK